MKQRLGKCCLLSFLFSSHFPWYGTTYSGLDPPTSIILKKMSHRHDMHMGQQGQGQFFSIGNHFPLTTLAHTRQNVPAGGWRLLQIKERKAWISPHLECSQGTSSPDLGLQPPELRESDLSAWGMLLARSKKTKVRDKPSTVVSFSQRIQLRRQTDADQINRMHKYRTDRRGAALWKDNGRTRPHSAYWDMEGKLPATGKRKALAQCRLWEDSRNDLAQICPCLS